VPDWRAVPLLFLGFDPPKFSSPPRLFVGTTRIGHQRGQHLSPLPFCYPTRREIGWYGGAAAWPIAARAQQQAQRVSVIGFLRPGFSDTGSPVFDALREGLREGGYVEGDSVKLEARWARGTPELLSISTRSVVLLRRFILANPQSV